MTAPMESPWASLEKQQAHHQHHKTRDEARADILHYIYVFYNTRHSHSALVNQSLLDFSYSFVSDIKGNQI